MTIGIFVSLIGIFIFWKAFHKWSDLKHIGYPNHFIIIFLCIILIFGLIIVLYLSYLILFCLVWYGLYMNGKKQKQSNPEEKDRKKQKNPKEYQRGKFWYKFQTCHSTANTYIAWLGRPIIYLIYPVDFRVHFSQLQNPSQLVWCSISLNAN